MEREPLFQTTQKSSSGSSSAGQKSTSTNNAEGTYNNSTTSSSGSDRGRYGYNYQRYNYHQYHSQNYPKGMRDQWDYAAADSTESGLNDASATAHQLQQENNKKISCMNTVLCILLLIVTVVFVLLTSFFVPRAPTIELQTSQIVNYCWDPFHLVIIDTIYIYNRNFGSLTLLYWEWVSYHDDHIVGAAESSTQYKFPPRDGYEVHFNRTISGKATEPPFSDIIRDCDEKGSFTLVAKGESLWDYLLSTQTLLSKNEYTYNCPQRNATNKSR